MRDSASPEDRRKAGEVITSLPWSSGLPVPIDSFKLIKSTLTPQGPLYEALHTVALPLS
jgi:2'-5' RNA ligase